jgi:hypothetical protein
MNRHVQRFKEVEPGFVASQAIWLPAEAGPGCPVAAMTDEPGSPVSPQRQFSTFGRNPGDQKFQAGASHGVAFASLVLVRSATMEILLGQKEVFDDFEYAMQVSPLCLQPCLTVGWQQEREAKCFHDVKSELKNAYVLSSIALPHSLTACCV